MRGGSGLSYFGLLVACLLVLLGVVPSAPAADSGFAAREQWAAGTEQFVVAPDPHWPPIEFFDAQGRYQGLAADYLRLAAKELGLSLRVRRLDNWAQAVGAVRSGEADVLGAARKTAERERFARFTQPFYEVPTVLVVRQGDRTMTSLGDLEAVGAVRGYAVAEYLRRTAPELTLHLVPDTATGLRQLSLGHLPALVTELPAATFLQSKLGLSNLRFVETLDYSYPLSFAVRRDAPGLYTRLEAALAGIANEQRRALERKWIGLDHSELLRDSWFWKQVLGATLLVVLVVFVPLYGLQREKIRRRTRQLQTSEDKFRSVFEQSHQLMALLSVDGTLIEANDRALEFMGADRAFLRGHELTALPWWTGVEDDNEEMAAAIRLAATGEVVHGRTRNIAPSGRTVWIDYSVKPVFGEEETPHYLVVEGRDVTAYLQAKQALEENERMLSTLLANLPGMVYRCSDDPRWKMEYVSRGCKDLTGYDEATLTTRMDPEYGDLILDEDKPFVLESVEQALTSKESFQVTYRIQDADGVVKWVWEQGRGVWSEGGDLESIEGFVTDVTAQRQLEEQLRRSQRLESVGRLAGWAAHDFNNMLTPILGYAEILLAGAPEGGKEAAKLEQIHAAAERARQLARQLLAFSRNQVLAKAHLDLREMVQGFWDILSQGVREDIFLELTLSEGPCRVMGDAHQLEQVLMNLVLNSQDAMLEGGSIQVAVAPIELDAGYQKLHPEIAPGRYIQLSVADTGVGMDRETQRQAFDPFFTTKGEEGTGLGLSSVHGILKQHGGHAEIYSEPGAGTVVKLFLPQVDEGSSHSGGPQTLQEQTFVSGSETVLVVEDNEMVRELTCEVLFSLGYSVVSAAEPREGMRVASQTEEEIALLVTDVVMPYMDGRKLYQELQVDRPGLRALFISGYTDNHIANTGGMEAGTAFLQKPFTSQELARSVRQVLDA